MLVAEDLRKSFAVEKNLFGRPTATITPVDGVSLTVTPGSTLAVVGESGCGKSTTAELMLMLQRPDSGTVHLDGQDLVAASPSVLRRMRRSLQVVFQDPYSSLNPSHTIGRILEEPLEVHRIGDSAERLDTVRATLERVGLPSGTAVRDRYPSEFSGGQRQRIAIARALVLEPSYVVLDEAVSALDVSTQAQILQLLVDLQTERDLGYLFISHDLGVVRRIATDIAVMYLGRVVEHAPVEELYDRPRHPYTAGLLASVPRPDPALQRARRTTAVSGEPPDPAARPAGCAFHPRCPHAQERCAIEEPALRDVDGTKVACHFAEEIDLGLPTRRTADA